MDEAARHNLDSQKASGSKIIWYNRPPMRTQRYATTPTFDINLSWMNVSKLKKIESKPLKKLRRRCLLAPIHSMIVRNCLRFCC